MKIRSTQDLGAGVFLIALAAIALWQGSGLAAGTLGQMGPGMLPRALAVITAICGVALVGDALVADGAKLESWSLRGPILILGAAIAFGLTVRPLGLAVAGPVTIMISAFASPETRWTETIVFSIVLTALCLGLFKFALGLPIPVAPWLINY